MDWQPIMTLPRNEEEYLACDDRVAGGFYQVVYWEPAAQRLGVPDAQISYAPEFFTHWARLPLTPADTLALPIGSKN